MAGAKDFKIAFGVDASELASGLANAQSAVAEAAAGMREAFKGVQDAFGLIGEGALALTGILAGGAAFREMIASTLSLNVQSMELGKQFGISASQASVLKLALGETFLTQDQLSAAGSRITRTLNTNEGAFKSLGVATRDSNGNFRSTLDILVDVNAKLLQFKEGTDRNVEGAKIYGRGWSEVSDILRLTGAAMTEAKVTADQLGLTVSKESEATTQSYRSSMEGVRAVFEGVSNAIGQALMPRLASLGDWFRSIGPSTIEATRAAMQTLGVVFDSVGSVCQTLWGIVSGVFSGIAQAIAATFGGEPLTVMEFFKNVLREIEVAFIATAATIREAATVIVGIFEGLATAAMTWVRVRQAVMSGDWEGAKAAWAAGGAALSADFSARMKTIVDTAKQSGHDIQEALTGALGQAATATPTAPPAGSKTSEGGADKNFMAQAEAELAATKLKFEQEQLAQGTFEEFSKQQELAFWSAKLAAGEAAGAQRVALEKKIADLSIAINKQAFDSQIAGLKAQEAEFSKNAEIRVGIAKKEAQQIGQAYGFIGPEYEASLKHVTETERAALEQQRQIAETYAKADEDRLRAEIAEDQRILREKLANHLISAKQLEAGEIELENRLTEIDRAGAEARLGKVNAGDDPVLYAQLKAQIETIEAQHQQRMKVIQQQGATDQDALYRKMQTSLQNTLEGGFQRSFQGIITGTMTVTKAFQSMYSSLLSSLASTLAQMSAKWIVQHTLLKTLNASEQSSNAAVAAAGAAKSASSIPYIGWILAPIAAVAVYAAATAFSAAEGFDVPAGLNPVTQLHQREMVLPADIADRFRDGGGGFSGPDVHVHIQAMDSSDIDRHFSKPGNRDILAKHIRKAYDRGSPYTRR